MGSDPKPTIETIKLLIGWSGRTCHVHAIHTASGITAKAEGPVRHVVRAKALQTLIQGLSRHEDREGNVLKGDTETQGLTQAWLANDAETS